MNEAAFAPIGAAPAEDGALVHYTLPNGLEVVLQRDAAVPKVALTVAYKAGSVNEPPGRSGFAHLFEHLMFSGTPAYPEVDVVYAALGIEANAFTAEDRTTYHAEGLSSTLPVMLSVEADRMANQGMAITQEHLDTQRGVVINEMRQNLLDMVGSSAWEALKSAVFPAGHPYARSVIGSIPDLNAATIADVRAFFDAYYAPNNAILVLAGDFDLADARAMIADTFGRVPPGTAVVVASELALPTPVRAVLTFEDRSPTPIVMLAWTVPPYASSEIGAHRLIADLVGHPEYGTLRRTLIDTGLATSAFAWLEALSLASRFVVYATAAEGVEPSALEDAIRATMGELSAAPFGSADVERARKSVLIQDRIAVESLNARSVQIAAATHLLGDPRIALVDDPAVVAATTASMHTAARIHLVPADASLATVLPGSRGDYPSVVTEPTGAPAPIVTAPRPGIDIPRLDAREPKAAQLPVRETARLSNGIEVVHYPVRNAAMNYIAAVSSAGALSAPEGREGIVELAVTIASRGGGGLDRGSYGAALKDLGAEVEWKTDDVAAMLTLQAPSDTLGAAAPLFANAIRRPAFSPHEFAVAKAELINNLHWREGDLPDVAARAAEGVLFPKVTGEAAIDETVESVSAITRDEAEAIFARMFTPTTTSFHSVGPTTLAEVTKALEGAFADWAAVAEPLPGVVRRPAAFPQKRRVLVAAEPNASQSAIYVIRPAPGIADKGRAEMIAVFRTLTADFLSRLNIVIREGKGLSYGTDGDLLDAVRFGSGMAVRLSVAREATAEALADVFDGFGSLDSEPITAEELERVVTAYHLALAGAAETAHGLFEDVTTQLGRGSTLEEAYASRIRITQLELADVQVAGKSLASLEQAVVVIVGDPDILALQLADAGIEAELVVRPVRAPATPQGEPASPPVPPSDLT